MAHTPGPWTYAPHRVEGFSYCVQQRGSTMLANIWPCGDILETKANARLIAAAPDLLEACKAGLARIESDIESPGQKTGDGDSLRAAIAKAEGREP